MPPQSKEPDRDELLPENDLSGIKDLDATEDGSHALPDSDATVDADSGISDSQTRPNSEATNAPADPDATYIPGSDVQSRVKEWEASLSDNSECRRRSENVAPGGEWPSGEKRSAQMITCRSHFRLSEVPKSSGLACCRRQGCSPTWISGLRFAVAF
jgi:hypothetical protein